VLWRFMVTKSARERRPGHHRRTSPLSCGFGNHEAP